MILDIAHFLTRKAFLLTLRAKWRQERNGWGGTGWTGKAR